MCENLKTISLPKSISGIEDYAFDKCDALTDVYFGGTEEEWTKIGGNECFINVVVHYDDNADVENSPNYMMDINYDGIPDCVVQGSRAAGVLCSLFLPQKSEGWL